MPQMRPRTPLEPTPPARSFLLALSRSALPFSLLTQYPRVPAPSAQNSLSSPTRAPSPPHLRSDSPLSFSTESVLSPSASSVRFTLSIAASDFAPLAPAALFPTRFRTGRSIPMSSMASVRFLFSESARVSVPVLPMLLVATAIEF